MCGRFVLSSPASVIAKEFKVEQPSLDIKANYNVAPSQKIVIIRNEGVNMLKMCRWGFIPDWAKDPDESYKMINARAETIADKPTFKNAFKNQRCLIIADGFFEWQREGSKKIPLFIRLKSGKTFALAGLYNVLTSAEGERVCSCTIITTEANELLEQIHDRMPVIMPKEVHDLWLDPDVQDRDLLLSLLKPYDYADMEAYYISPKVNSPKYNAPDILESLNPMKRL